MAKNKLPRVFLETSAIIRFFTRDEEVKFKHVVTLFQAIEAGQIRAVTSNIVILEVIFVLTKLYGFSREQVGEAVTLLLEMRSLIVIEKTQTKSAFALWLATGKPFGDCSIAVQVPKDTELVTFNKDFKMLPGLHLYQWPA